jgi:hypothetical protein
MGEIPSLYEAEHGVLPDMSRKVFITVLLAKENAKNNALRGGTKERGPIRKLISM